MKKVQTVVLGSLTKTKSEIDKEARQLAHWLHTKAVAENDIVAALLWNDCMYFSLPKACALLGAYFVPLNWHITRAELDYIVADCAAKVLIGHDILLSRLCIENTDIMHVLAVTTPDVVIQSYPKLHTNNAQGNWDFWSDCVDYAEYEGEAKPGNRGGIFYTSGTTGNPKGVKRCALTDDIWSQIVMRTQQAFGLQGGGEGHVTLVPGPLYHSAPNAHAINAWEMGMDIVLMPRFDASHTLTLMQNYNISHVHMVPTMFSRMLALSEYERSQYTATDLVAVCHGAAACPHPVKKAMLQWFGPVILEYYAGTETGIISYSTSQQWLDHPGTVGRPAGECIVTVIDDDGAQVPNGTTGQLICHSHSTTSFTYHNHHGTKHINNWPGFVSLGDRGHIDKDGYIYLTERRSDVVISGGVNISQVEIEKELAVLAGVSDCVVIGVPHKELGEAVIALIEPTKDALPTQSELLCQLQQRLALYKIPRKLIFVDHLPREDSGKIRKRDLQKTYKDVLNS